MKFAYQQIAMQARNERLVIPLRCEKRYTCEEFESLISLGSEKLRKEPTKDEKDLFVDRYTVLIRISTAAKKEVTGFKKSKELRVSGKTLLHCYS